MNNSRDLQNVLNKEYFDQVYDKEYCWITFDDRGVDHI